MNYKKNTPFKLKGSPFKETDDPSKKIINESGLQEDGTIQYGSTVVVRDPNKSINNVYNAPTVSNNKKISYKQAFDNMSAGDKLKKGYSNDDEGFQKFKGEAIEYNSLNKNYNEGLDPKIPEGGLKGDLYKVNVETKGVDLDMGQTKTEKTTRIDTLKTRDKGDAMKSWERRSEIRDIKNIARQDKKAQRKIDRLNRKSDKTLSAKEQRASRNKKQAKYIQDNMSSIKKVRSAQSSQGIKGGSGKSVMINRLVDDFDNAETVGSSQDAVDKRNTIPFRMGGYGSKNKQKK
tara:strand:- start:110 stop:979 length:870 start_codon:yes stop_codon:yes gene_type:complete